MKKFKVEYAADVFGSEWFPMGDFIEAETKEEAIELAKDYAIEQTRSIGVDYEAAVRFIVSHVWRAEIVDSTEEKLYDDDNKTAIARLYGISTQSPYRPNEEV